MLVSFRTEIAARSNRGDCLTFSNLELIDIHARALFLHDGRDRLVAVNTIEGLPTPRLYLGRTPEGNIWRYRHDLAPGLVAELEAILAVEPVTADLEGRAVTFELLAAALERSAPVRQVWEGLAWVVPEVIVSDPERQSIPVTPELEIHEARHRWLVDELAHWQPRVVLMLDGRVVSYCHSARTSPVAAEAGVETMPEYRGRGYGAAVVAAWARAVRAQGRIPLYSTSWENHASRALARKLGLRLYGAGLRFT